MSLVVMIGGAGWLAYRLYPDHVRLPKNPNFIDNIFGNDLALFAGRLVLVAAAAVLAVTAVFIVKSYWERGKAGHWLTRFGPLETQAVEDLRGEVETWQNNWYEAMSQATELQGQLEESNALLLEAQDEIDRLTGEAA